MYEGKTIAVVVPCYNEETQIEKVLETMPTLVDCIIVVDDCSQDKTVELVEKQIAAEGENPKTILIQMETNAGVGAAILAGYHEAIRREIAVTAVMAGDAQMDPDELHTLVGPVARGELDYAKGNRLFYEDAWNSIPRLRYFGNAFLSMLTKIASGYWHVADSQTGYTAISLAALRAIKLDGMYPRYGYPNDMLVRCNTADMRVRDIPIRPVYNVGEQSKMRLWKVIPTMSCLIGRRFLWRMWHKYVIRDFHPLILFYSAGFTSFMAGLGIGLYLLAYRILRGPVQATSGLFSMLLFTTGLQLLLFGMWFDMESNKHLR